MSTSEQRSGQPARPAKSERAEPPKAVRFMTVAEVAASMRVSKMTVYRMVHNGDLAAVRVGRSFRVPERAVDEYLSNAYIEAG
jgi:excisionase family DNA binding protein